MWIEESDEPSANSNAGVDSEKHDSKSENNNGINSQTNPKDYEQGQSTHTTDNRNTAINGRAGVVNGTNDARRRDDDVALTTLSSEEALPSVSVSMALQTAQNTMPQL